VYSHEIIPLTSLKGSKQIHRKTHRHFINAIFVLFGALLLLGILIWNPKIGIWIAEAAQSEFVGTNPPQLP
jgi:hypothetical protein